MVNPVLDEAREVAMRQVVKALTLGLYPSHNEEF